MTPSQEFATEVVRTLTRAGFIAYWAGGCVRDLLRGELPNDYDVATTATPDEVRQTFGPKRTLAVGESFGVIIVLGPKGSGLSLEIATFRREGEYADGRRPDRVEYCTPEEDARRRDFTINGMFYDPLTQSVHDFVGGQADLQAKLVRAIGDPRDRMGEDKLRMLRAVRFASMLDFQLDEPTAFAVADMASQVVIVSAERIAQELRKMLAHPRRARAVRLCAELKLLDVVLPEVQTFTRHVSEERWQQILKLLEDLGAAEFAVALAALLRDVPSPETRRDRSPQERDTVLAICRRLKLSNDETDRVCWLTAQRGSLAELPRQSLASIKRMATQPGFGDLLQLERTAAQVEGREAAPYVWLDEFLLNNLPADLNPPELVTGRDLIDLGYAAGPNFKDWLTAVRDAQLNGEISNRDEALELVRQLVEG
jgi:poly(A) polymerase